jgi:DNA-binding NarL/FixJ family response regulator
MGHQHHVAAVGEHRPDLALIDVRMPPGFTDEGVHAALAIRRQWLATAVLLLSQYVEERYATDLLTANTSGVGYLLKQRVADVEEFAATVRRVAVGGTALDPQVVAQLLLRRDRDPLERLTPREREVPVLMAEGRSDAAIAEDLVVTDSAVAKHINNIFAKLDLPVLLAHLRAGPSHPARRLPGQLQDDRRGHPQRGRAARRPPPLRQP